MPSLLHRRLICHLLTLSLLLPTTLSATCTTTSSKLTSLYASCTDLPTLSSTLHYTFTPSNKTLLVAFTATPPSSSGWVAWGINPTSTGMAGTQAILAYKSSSGPTLKTLNISSYTDVSPGKLSFPVYAKIAEVNSDGSITIHASVMSSGGKINHVWQMGPGVTPAGIPMKHEFSPQNLHSKATLDVTEKTNSPDNSSSGEAAALKKRNTHGILNAIIWDSCFQVELS